MAGKIEKFPYEIKEIEWSINNFFRDSQDERIEVYDSPAFSFTDTDGPWFLELYPRWRENDGFIFLKFFREINLEYSVECYFGLKRSDGSVQQLNSGTLAQGKTISDAINLIKKSELLKRKSELAPGNTLTVTCTLKFHTEISHSTPMALDETKSTKLIKDGTVCEDYKKVFLDGQNHDLILKVGNREFPVHQDILRARSRVFDSMLSHNMKAKDNAVVDVPNCDPKAMEHLLLYIYNGQIEISDESIMFGLYCLADKFDMAALKEECHLFIMKAMSPTNICQVIALSNDNSDRMTTLLQCATEYFCNNLERILNTAEWQSFMKDNSILANELLKKSLFKLKNPNFIDLIIVE